MTVEIAKDYLKKRMRYLGFGENYYEDFKHIVLQPNEIRFEDGYNELWILAEDTADVRVESRIAVFDLSAANINEQKYEHQGKIKIQNYSAGINHVRFIRAIIKHKTETT